VRDAALVVRGLCDGGFKLDPDLEALGVVDAIAEFSLQQFDQFVNARHRGNLLSGAQRGAGLPLRRPACRGFSSRGSR
jgi:hypothetical protein